MLHVGSRLQDEGGAEAGGLRESRHLPGAARAAEHELGGDPRSELTDTTHKAARTAVLAGWRGISQLSACLLVASPAVLASSSDIAETKRIQSVLFGLHNRTFGSLFGSHAFGPSVHSSQLAPSCKPDV
jgi:hypothetical protein